MAQLPPKSPCTMSPSWQFTFGAAGPGAASFLPTPAPPAPGWQPPWVDEFLDFSSAKRSHHRRSVSDSMTAFQLDDEDDFDRLDDDQLLSMFSDSNVPAPSSSSSSAAEVVVPASSSSDQSSFSWDCQKPPAETQERSEAEPPPEIIVDPKRVKRILANRQSAQRSRVRKIQYISELERSVTTLQNEVSALSPRVAFLDQQRSMLTLGNNQLKQRIAALAQDKIFKDAHQEELKNEVERLRQVYHHQQKLQTTASPTPTSQPTVITERELLC